MTTLDEKDFLAAILAGDRTKTQVARRLQIPAGSEQMYMALHRLVGAGYLAMQVVDGAWNFLPTGRAKRADLNVLDLTQVSGRGHGAR